MGVLANIGVILFLSFFLFFFTLIEIFEVELQVIIPLYALDLGPVLIESS